MGDIILFFGSILAVYGLIKQYFYTVAPGFRLLPYKWFLDGRYYLSDSKENVYNRRLGWFYLVLGLTIGAIGNYLNGEF